jgi:hypothetical protein
MRKPTLQQRIRAKSRSQAMLVGVVGYTAETWAQMKATASDPQCFEDSFEKWHATAVAARRSFLRSGVRAVECRIDPTVFAEWCVQHRRENNANSRAEFVSETLSAAQG